MKLDKSIWQVVLVKLTCHPRLQPLFKSLDKWQLVKSTCQVNLQGDPPKITFASCPKNSPRGVLGGGSGHSYGQKKGPNRWLFRFLAMNFWGKMMFLTYFGMFYNTRGCNATWQCYCVVGGFSATICRQYQRWDMPLIINCVLLPLHSHILATLLSGGSDRGFVCRKFLWAYSFWGQWCVSRWKYASQYGRDQHVGCVKYKSIIHITHAWNLPQVEWSKFQRNISISGFRYES